ncbi:MAG: bifunctional N-acetylglucosamine-1-phosphate uridyltransferase/glucosamine-1-phosphate acetyltransferase [Bellilinea sp.]
MQPDASVSVIILAAGFGKRMKSSLPKVLHPLGGLPLVEHCLRSAATVSGQPPVLVVGHGAEQVRAAVGERARYALQSQQLGTAHAVRMAQPLLEGRADWVVVTAGDMPLITAQTLQRLVDLQRSADSALTMLTVILDDPHGFGRVVRSPEGDVEAIVEEAVAPPEVLALRELNAGVYCFDGKWLWQALSEVGLSPKGEYFLTDLVAIARKQGRRVQAVTVPDPHEALGINTRAHLAEAQAVLQRRIAARWMEAGVTLVDPSSTTIEVDVTIGADTLLYPQCYLGGQTRIGANCRLGPGAVLWNTQVGDNCRIAAAWLEDCTLADGVSLPPYTVQRGGFISAAESEA